MSYYGESRLRKTEVLLLFNSIDSSDSYFMSTSIYRPLKKFRQGYQ